MSDVRCAYKRLHCEPQSQTSADGRASGTRAEALDGAGDTGRENSNTQWTGRALNVSIRACEAENNWQSISSITDDFSIRNLRSLDSQRHTCLLLAPLIAMCSPDPELPPQVNQAKCWSIAIMVFSIISLIGFVRLSLSRSVDHASQPVSASLPVRASADSEAAGSRIACAVRRRMASGSRWPPRPHRLLHPRLLRPHQGHR